MDHTYPAEGEYRAFLDRRRHEYNAGFEIAGADLNAHLFPFQRELVQWALLKGRGAIFADTGLGKTLMELAWSEAVTDYTGGRVLILTPLAVSHQTAREAARFGIDAHVSRDGTLYPITITNYERLHYFRPEDFVGCVCDESAILKSFDGRRRTDITVFMRKMTYRLLASATPAPNDYTELGTSSEALGYLGHTDMLTRFFVNDQNTIRPVSYRHRGQNFQKLAERSQWRFKGHAEDPFWRWVCSWARAVRRPSDLGYDDGAYILPPLTEREHVVSVNTAPPGMLFAVEAISLAEQREERRRTINERCAMVAELVDHDRPALVWCHLNDEGDLLTRSIPGAVQVSGADDDDAKESKLLAFVNGDTRVLVTKPKIAGWGLNFQHCAHLTFFPSHSFEAYYQGVRRCWRFGQTQPVTVDIVTTPGEVRVLANLQAKAAAADRMFSNLTALMNQGMHVQRTDDYTLREELPAWL